MIENKKCSNSKSFKLSALAAGVAIVGGAFVAPASAEMTFESDNGWRAGLNGYIPIFAVMSNFEDARDEDSFNVTTGFNPATLQTNLYAPTQNGLEVSGHFQMNADIAPGDADANFRSRVSEIAVAGSFGRVNIGKGFGIFGTPAIGDNGSALGVGLLSGPDEAAATAGRIGNGYFYANFTPRVMYTSNNLGGLQFKVGIFSPSKLSSAEDPTVNGVGDAEYSTPRFEGNVVYSAEMFSLWSSAFTQDIDSNSGGFEDYTISGIDFGGSVSLAGLTVRGNYAMTSGTGNGVFAARFDPNEEDAEQWYVETTYDINRFTIGASYGEGSDDIGVRDSSDVLVEDQQETDLTMVFARYRATDALTLMAEVQDYSTNAVTSSGYKAFVVGSQFTF